MIRGKPIRVQARAAAKQELLVDLHELLIPEPILV